MLHAYHPDPHVNVRHESRRTLLAGLYSMRATWLMIICNMIRCYTFCVTWLVHMWRDSCIMSHVTLRVCIVCVRHDSWLMTHDSWLMTHDSWLMTHTIQTASNIQRVMYLRHVTQMRSCKACRIWMSHVTHTHTTPTTRNTTRVMSHMNESCHTHTYYTDHNQHTTSHVTYEWVMSHTHTHVAHIL